MNIDSLNWDDENDDYINTKHGVTAEEVEEVCYGLHFSRRDPDSKSGGKERYILSGKTEAGRYLDVVIERLYDNCYRPVTAFDMSKNYQRSFIRKLNRRKL